MARNLEHYFDHGASTPLDPRVREVMLPFFGENYGNPSSIHSWGRTSRTAVERARIKLATALGAEDASQIVFTSGATEGNNWIIQRYGPGLVSPFEHSSVRESANTGGCKKMASDGPYLKCVEGSHKLISVMHVNNETGTIWDPAPYRPYAENLHSDLTQAFGKVPTSIEPLDFATLSAHKIYGPQGVGALYVQEGFAEPLLYGGDQENGLRSGTLNVMGIVGLGEAARIASAEQDHDYAHALHLKGIVMEEIAGISDLEVNGGESCSPFVLNVSFRGIVGESVVVEMDAKGFALSAGSACSSGSGKGSAVLLAMGYDIERVRGAIRISFGRPSTVEGAHALGLTLVQVVQSLRKMKC